MKSNFGRLLALLLSVGVNVSNAQLTTEELKAANAGQLRAVPAESLPAFGSFNSWQRPWQPPLPYDPFPELAVYDLGGSRFLMDDRQLDYALISELAALMTESEGGGQAQMAAMTGGCGLWLSLSASASSNNAVLLALHNTRPNQTYVIWSITNIVSTNWVVETNVTGASGDLTGVNIATGQRTNLFLRASEERDYVMVTNFTGLGFADTGLNPPDTMGAVGPNHFVELLNSSLTNFVGIRVYDKSGNLIVQTNSLDFFRIGTNYPAGQSMVDPRIFYDQQSQRWVATALDSQGSKEVILAVSNGDSPTNLISGWSRYLLPLHGWATLTDFPTLGMDANGLYVSVLQGAGDTNAGHTIIAIKKPEVYQGTFISQKFEITNTLPVWHIQPVVSFDDVPTNGYAWFVAKGPPDLSTNYAGGAICYRRLQWSGTNAFMDTNWFILTNTVINYRGYYDLDGTNVTVFPPAGGGVNAPQSNGSPIDLHQTGSRLAISVIRNGFLWTCQAIGFSGTNGVYVGNQFGTNVDRTGVQWLKLGVDAANGSLSYSAHGRVYDPKPNNPPYYYFPSLMVNCAGDMVMGFSGSSATNYISAYYTWRLSNEKILNQPRLIRAGITNFPSTRWGDYSATTLDPTDDWSFWTVQQYADPAGDDSQFPGFPWSTAIARIRPSP